MINKQVLKKLSLLLLIINLFSINIGKVIAATSDAYAGGDDGPYTSETTGGPPSGPGPLSCDAGAGWTATCSARTSWGMGNPLTIEMWDMYGNYIAQSFDFEKNISELGLNNILAGTYVTLDVYEKKTYWKRVNIISNGIQEYHDCRRERTVYYVCGADPKTKEPIMCSTIVVDVMSHVAGTNCPGDYVSTATYWEWTSSCDSARQTCKNRNKPSREELYPSFTVNYRDSNDIDSDEITTVQPILKSHTTNDHDGNWYWYISDTKIFSYNREKTCINVKTSDVRYIGKSENCNLTEENEYTIRTADGRWKYFIPLDANSYDNFSFYTQPLNNGMLSGAQCQNLISNSPSEYLLLIQPIRGSLTGNINNDKQKVANGCYRSNNVIIPIDQRFYNELENGKNFKGFNFYYKPIDIDNPFPNGLTNTSIWYDWNESDVKNPDLSDSYNGTPTYVAYTSGNEYSIRQYNKLEEYTSWDNMYVSGISKFIENENIIQRNVDRDSFYALGCGPKNSTNDVNNVFYQQECDIS